MFKQICFSILIAFFVIGSQSGLGAQSTSPAPNPVIYGSWDVLIGVSYHFMEDGTGYFEVHDDTVSIDTFTFRVDSIAGELCLKLTFKKKSMANVCFLFRPVDQSHITVYHLPDPRQCPANINELDIIRVTWTRKPSH